MRLRRFARGDDDADDVGEGGPKLDAGIRVCGEGATTEGEATLDGGISGEGRVCTDTRCDLETSGGKGDDVLDNAGVSGTEGVVAIAGVEGKEGRCKSLEIRFEIT